MLVKEAFTFIQDEFKFFIDESVERVPKSILEDIESFNSRLMKNRYLSPVAAPSNMSSKQWEDAIITADNMGLDDLVGELILMRAEYSPIENKKNTSILPIREIREADDTMKLKDKFKFIPEDYSDLLEEEISNLPESTLLEIKAYSDYMESGGKCVPKNIMDYDHSNMSDKDWERSIYEAKKLGNTDLANELMKMKLEGTRKSRRNK